MPPAPQPDDLNRKIEELERRLRALETAPRATKTSVGEGSFEVLDADENLVTVLGDIGLGYGVYVRHPDTGIYLFYASTDFGLAAPYQQVQVRDPNDSTPVTSATFVVARDHPTEQIRSDAVKVRVPYVVDAATTGEIRVEIGGTSDHTSIIDLPASGSGYAEFNWIHGLTIGVGPVFFEVQARRTSGVGNVYIFQSTCYEGGSFFFGATATGV